MNENVLVQLMQEINRENIRFGSCEVKFTFHDGKIKFYELMTSRRINVEKTTSISKKEKGSNYD